MDPYEAFGPWVKRRRSSLALTQDDLAQLIAYPTVTVLKLESGDLRPSRALAEKLAEALEVPAEQLAAFVDFARNEPTTSTHSPPSLVSPLSSNDGCQEAPSPPVLARQPPSGTVTFLFTDVEGSVRLAEDYPDDMPALLDRHNEILHLAIAGHGGYVFQIAGDAFCAAFSRPSDALSAALAAQRTLQQEAWHPVQVKVRMGLHTGEAQVTLEGERLEGYTGYETLARTQRVMSAAYGGQVLLSRTTVELLRGHLPTGAALRDMGEHRLKGLLNPEHLSQLVAPGIRESFPPLATLDKVPTNLPVQLTSFIGRAGEIDQIAALLLRERLLTLTGPGGTGKTRLALEAAAHLVDAFPHGVWFIELARLQDEALVAQTVASTLGLRAQPGRQLEDGLVDYLQGKHVLLILDNCEHLGDAPARLCDHLLHDAPDLKVLATSRSPLELAGERLYPLPPLSVPRIDGYGASQSLPLPALTQYEAVRLLIERGRAVRPTFEVTSANAPAVAQICYRLDGIPLAIELAAARLRSLSVQEIAARLDDRFRLLTGGSRTAMPRHQTLRAAIDWSYVLLTEPEQALLRRLSVFVGGFTLEAAEEVCAGEAIPSADVLDLLSHLVDKSLVVQEIKEESSRYSVLETVRQYAGEKLVASEEAAATQDRHLAYFASVAERKCLKPGGREQVTASLTETDQKARLDRLEQEHGNLRAALDWSKAGGNRAELGLEMAAALADFWADHSHLTEGRGYLQGLLEANPSASPARAKALAGLGTLTYWLGDYEQASAYHEQALALYRQLGDRQGILSSLNNLGVQALRKKESERAQSLFEESLSLARQEHDEPGIAAALNSLGGLAAERREYAVAKSFFQAGLDLVRAGQDRLLVAYFLHNLGETARMTSDYVLARQYHQECLGLAEALGNKQLAADTLNWLGVIAKLIPG